MIFKGKEVSAIKIVVEIVNIVRETVSNWRKIPRTKANWDLVMEWGLDHNCFE